MNAPRPLRLLLVANDPSQDALATSGPAAGGCDGVDWSQVTTAATARALLETASFDAALLDLSLPDFSAKGALRTFVEAEPSLPIIALTGCDDVGAGSKAVQEGAQDHQAKGCLDLERLRRSILHFNERKAILAAMEILQQRHEQILSSLDEGVIGVDRKGQAVFLNPAILAITGYTRDEILGRSPHAALGERRLDGGSEPQEESPVLATLADGEIRQAADIFLVHKNGSRIPVEYVVAPVREAGEIAGAVVMYKDLSAQHDALNVLVRQFGFHQSVIDSLPTPLFYLDADGLVLGCNLAFARRLGRHKVTFLGCPAADEFPSPLAAAVHNVLEEGPAPAHGPLPSHRASLIDGGVNISPILMLNGECAGYVGYLTSSLAFAAAHASSGMQALDGGPSPDRDFLGGPS
jgi:PAS domain S-box-containing protein